MHDERFGSLIHELARLMREHGARTEPVRQFIRAHVDVPDFKDSAVLLVMIAETFQDVTKERELLGRAPPCFMCMGTGGFSSPCETCSGTGDEPTPSMASA